MIVLALDLSTRVGWACGRAGSAPDHGVIHLPGAASVGLGGVLAAAVDGLADLHAVQHFGRVVVEAPLPPQSQTHAATALQQLGLHAAVALWCYRRELPMKAVASVTARAAVLGRARFGGSKEAKAAVLAWCRARGHAPADDNAADALLLLHHALTGEARKARAA